MESNDEREMESNDESEDKSRCRPLDPVELDNILQGERRKSKDSKIWAENTREWCEFNTKDSSKSIGDLYEQINLMELVDELSTFVLQVKKKNEELYKPESIQGLIRSIGRLIRARQELCAIEMGHEYIPFNIMKDAKFKKVRAAGDESVLRSSATGLGRRVSKNDLLTPHEEQLMLNQLKCSWDTPEGLNWHFFYYYTRNFFIRGVKEMCKVNHEDFKLMTLHTGHVLRFNQGVSKNWNLTLADCNLEYHRKLVDCQIKDIVKTFKQLTMRRPVWEMNEPRPHLLFLKVKKGWKPTMSIWYTKVPLEISSI